MFSWQINGNIVILSSNYNFIFYHKHNVLVSPSLNKTPACLLKMYIIRNKRTNIRKYLLCAVCYVILQSIWKISTNYVTFHFALIKGFLCFVFTNCFCFLFSAFQQCYYIFRIVLDLSVSSEWMRMFFVFSFFYGISRNRFRKLHFFIN